VCVTYTDGLAVPDIMKEAAASLKFSKSPSKIMSLKQ
jgi:hypothetical protein